MHNTLSMFGMWMSACLRRPTWMYTCLYQQTHVCMLAAQLLLLLLFIATERLFSLINFLRLDSIRLQTSPCLIHV